MFYFSKTSKLKLSTCAQPLQDVMNLALTRSNVDFGISAGFRSIEEQQRLYAQGRTIPGNIVTNVDGIVQKSMHNYKPALAVDIYAYTNKAIWDAKYLCYLAGVIISCASELKISIRWGGNWNRNGIIITDQNFMDLPHFELIWLKLLPNTETINS